MPGRALALALALLLALPLGTAAAQEAAAREADVATLGPDGEFPAREVTFGFPTLEWELTHDGWDGNPFDLVASAEFTHEETGETRRTEMFYAGGNSWRFRFTGTLVGEWSFVTASDEPQLDGARGRVTVVPNPDPAAQGFLTTSGTKFVVPVGPDGQRVRAVPYNVYITSIATNVPSLPREEGELGELVDAMLDEAEANGFPSIFLTVYNSWFALGAESYEDHDSEDPDPETFRLLERFITRAHERGMFVHIWAWGDEQRGWTTLGVGGINGEPDRRLQRYVAARLGPLPGWTMSYGFDLEEWVTPAEVAAWAEYVSERSGWPHLLMAREYGEHDGYVFELEEPWLPVYTTDDRPFDNPRTSFYELARQRFEERGRPVFFERRFLYTRDDVWDMDATRRALWQFTMAGGAGAVWGVLEWEDGPTYPEPGQLRTHARFWRDRLLPALEPRDGGRGTLVLADPALEHLVAYAEDARQVRFDLSGAPGPLRAVAVDTRAEEYVEIDLGPLEPGEVRWRAPHRSDWAVAVGYDAEAE